MIDDATGPNKKRTLARTYERADAKALASAYLDGIVAVAIAVVVVAVRLGENIKSNQIK